MKNKNKKAHLLLRNKLGQSTIEYVLILMIVVMVVLKFKKDFTDNVENANNGLKTGIDKVIQELNNTD